MLACPSLVYLHCVLAECQCVCVSVHVEVSVYVLRMWWKCQCLSVSVEVSVFKGFSGRTLRNAFGKKKFLLTSRITPELLHLQRAQLVTVFQNSPTMLLFQEKIMHPHGLSASESRRDIHCGVLSEQLCHPNPQPLEKEGNPKGHKVQLDQPVG